MRDLMKLYFQNVLISFILLCIFNVFMVRPANHVFNFNFVIIYLIFSFTESLMIGAIGTIIDEIISKFL